MIVEVIVGSSWQGSPVTCLARVQNAAGELITQAMVASITRKVYDKASPATPTGTGSLVVADTVFAELQTANWSIDRVGWNFRDVVPAASVPNAEAVYRIEHQIVLTTGEVIWVVYEDTTRNLYSL